MRAVLLVWLAWLAYVLALLGGEYFAQGVRRLEALQGWAAGRATLKPGEEEHEIK